MIYTVQEGDTLWTIAERLLGDADRWQELWSLNQKAIEDEQYKRGGRRRQIELCDSWRWQVQSITGPDWIFPGTDLIIPPKEK